MVDMETDSKGAMTMVIVMRRGVHPGKQLLEGGRDTLTAVAMVEVITIEEIK